MLQDHITSFTEGSVLLTHPVFSDAKKMGTALRLLRFYPGVKGVEHDATASTLKIDYDAKRLTKEKVMELLAQGEAWLKG